MGPLYSSSPATQAISARRLLSPAKNGRTPHRRSPHRMLTVPVPTDRNAQGRYGNHFLRGEKYPTRTNRDLTASTSRRNIELTFEDSTRLHLVHLIQRHLGSIPTARNNPGVWRRKSSPRQARVNASTTVRGRGMVGVTVNRREGWN